MKNTVNAMEILVGANKAKNTLDINNLIAKRVLGSDADKITALKADENKELNLANAFNVVSTLAKLGYVAGSKIGQIISLTCVCETLKDKELNKQFLLEGSNDMVDLHKLSLIFPKVGSKPSTMEGYETVFTKEQHRVVTDKLGRTQTVLLACKDKIEDFALQIEACSMLTLKDLVTIGRDLEIVATVMSELEIDAAKDEKKREGMIDISEFMNEYMTQSSRKFKVENNFAELKDAKKNNAAAHVKLAQTLCTNQTLFDYEDILKELKEERQAALDAGEKPEHEEWELPSVALKRCSVMDPLFELVEALVGVTNTQMETLGDLFRTSDMDLFKGFDITPQRDEAANKYKNETVTDSVVAIKKAAVQVYNMINSVYKYKKFMPMCRVEDVAEIGRNMIYTMATDRGISLADAFYLSVDAGWLKVDNKGQLTQRASFAYRACEAVFANELKCHFNADAMSKEVDIEIPEELFEVEDLFVENRLFEFVDGSCEVQGVDGEYYSMLRVDNDEFTGKVLVKIDEEGYLVFLEGLNPYEFERVDFFMLDSIANMTSAENRYSFEQVQALIAADKTQANVFDAVYNKSVVRDTNRFYANEAELLKFANEVEPVIGAFNNIVKFPVMMSERFALKPSPRRRHLYIEDNKGKAARFVGSLAGFSLSKQLKDCSDVRVVTTPVGSIIVVK